MKDIDSMPFSFVGWETHSLPSRQHDPFHKLWVELYRFFQVKFSPGQPVSGPVVPKSASGAALLFMRGIHSL